MRTRRDVLYGTGAILLAGSAIARETGAALAAESSEAAVSPAALSATLTLPNGQTRNFHGAQGKDLGDFKVPFAGIVQRNVIVKDPATQFSVFFRPDRNSGRVEVVVLYGDTFKGTPQTFGPYTLEVFADGKSLSKTEVPYHFWLARWRWASSPRKPVRRPADLVAAKLSVAYEKTSMTQEIPRPAPAYTIMGHSSVPTYMAQTGEGEYIGQNPDTYSCYMATEDQTAYHSMMTWAEAAATAPWHLNDPGTNAILNWDKFPLANTYDPQTSNPKLHLQYVDKDHADQFIQSDAPHHPSLSYLPFMLTGDPFHAEELQYQINYYYGHEHNSTGAKSYIFDELQTRGYSWMLRSTVFAYLAADQIQSPMLLPKAFWKKVLDKNRAWFATAILGDPKAKVRVFYSGTSKSMMGWWQEDFLCGVLAMMQRLGGFPDWKPAFDWKLKSNINRLNGTSGWPRTHPTIYYAQWFDQIFTPAPKNAGNGTFVPGGYSERDDPTSSWGDSRVVFKNSTTFEFLRPGGGSLGKGTVGTLFRAGSGACFTINPGSAPFAAGDTIKVTLKPLDNWKDLARVNGVTENPSGNLDGPKDVYMAHLYAAMALAAPVAPEIAPLLEWLKRGMQAGRAIVPWRDSFVAG